MSKQNYTPPEVDTLSGSSGEGKGAGTEVAVKETTTENANYKLPGKVIPDNIGIGSFVNAKGSAVTDLLASRVEQHFKYAFDKESFKSPAARAEEQGTFMNLILNSLDMEFEKFVVVTDYILTQLRNNEKDVKLGKTTRHIAGLDPNYDKEKIRLYTTYINFLVRIAMNWNMRYRMNELIDVNSAVQGFSAQGKENVISYFNNLHNV